MGLGRGSAISAHRTKTTGVHGIIPPSEILGTEMIKGVIVMWHGLPANVPSGWAICDGTIGTPDLRGRFVRGANINAGGTGGSDIHTLTETEMPSHVHGVNVTNAAGATFGVGGDNYDTTVAINTNSTGGDQPHNNMPAYYEIIYIMKT